jgi:putative oxidoreductase
MSKLHSPVDTITVLYRWLIQFGTLLRSPLLLLIRLCWGIQFFMTGLGKLMHIQKIIDYFTSIPIVFPALNAYLVGCTEMIGGALLTLGLASRLTAIPLAFTLVIAYLTTEKDAIRSLYTFTDVDPFLTAAPFLFLFACLIILAFGPGVFSLDHLIGRRFAKPSYLSAEGRESDSTQRLSS